MRPSGCARWKEGTIWTAIGNTVDETLAPRAIVVSHEVIATQQGIAADLQGFGCSLCWAGNSLLEPSWCGIAATPDPEMPPRE